MRRWVFAAIAAVLVLQGCSSARTTAYQGEKISAAKRIARDDVEQEKLILMVAGNLPPEVKIEILGEVRSHAQRYSTMDRMYNELAIRARNVGADAVIGVNKKMRVTFTAWAAPSISGVAVKIIDDGGIDIKKLDGQWR
ncbi:MAG: hypothetical protein KBT18_15230 [Comamonas sp.]|nr:hypothetical protein [Candidatus Comamonas equi]